MQKEILSELTGIKNVIRKLLSLYKLTHLEQIKEAKKKVLVSKTRRKVYDSCNGKKGVSEIAKALNLKQPSVTHHLTELYSLGLVFYETKKGKKYFLKII